VIFFKALDDEGNAKQAYNKKKHHHDGVFILCYQVEEFHNKFVWLQ